MKIFNKIKMTTSILILSMVIMLAGNTMVMATELTINMRTASNFAVLAGSTINNAGISTINGSVGLFPGTAFAGQVDTVVNGRVHINDAVANTAKTDLLLAFDDITTRVPNARIATELGGATLTPGTYDSLSGTFGITGNLTLDAQGDPNSVFIFKADTTLITATNSSVNLINGASSNRVFWQVKSSATLGTNSNFAGSIVALASITANSGAVVHGQLLAINGALTLNTNTITNEMELYIEPILENEVSKTNTTVRAKVRHGQVLVEEDVYGAAITIRGMVPASVTEENITSKEFGVIFGGVKFRALSTWAGLVANDGKYIIKLVDPNGRLTSPTYTALNYLDDKTSTTTAINLEQ